MSTESSGLNGQVVPVQAAITAPGMRLVVTKAIPGPWAEAAKGIFHIKAINHLRVWQLAGEENADLVRWTGINSAPIAVYGDEAPRAGWVEILMLAERVAPFPRLIPDDEADRATMFGLAHELCSEDGFGWNKRLKYFAAAEETPPDAGAPADGRGIERMRSKYGAGDPARARDRVLAVMALLCRRLEQQQVAGSPYFIGSSLTALDIYSACFMAMIRPLSEDHCPLTPQLRAAYTEQDPELLAAAAPLLAHRDVIYTRHLELPMRL